LVWADLQNKKKIAIIGGMEDTSFQSPVNQFSYSSPEMPKKPKKFVYFLIFLVIVVIFFFAKNMFSGSNKQAEQNKITPTLTEYQFPTDTPVPSISPAEEEKDVTPTAKAVNSIDKSTGLDRSKLTVEIQNGSGVTGAAAKASDALKGFGYKVSKVGNADKSDYADVTVQVKSAKSDFLALLKKDLGFSYTVGSASADLDSSSTADALVIIGK
jgi:hypothetical protein